MHQLQRRKRCWCSHHFDGEANWFLKVVGRPTGNEWPGRSLSHRRSACANLKSITEQHIADIRQRVKDVKRLERVRNGSALSR